MITEMIGADHRPQDHDLDRDAEHEHEDQRQRHADPERHLIFGEQRPAHPGADQQQFALREVHHLGGLVDQHKRHRHHAIERADHEAIDEKLDQELEVHGNSIVIAGLDPPIHRLNRLSVNRASPKGGLTAKSVDSTIGYLGIAKLTP